MTYDERIRFFHELGHFVAHELNAIHFGGPEVIRITLEPEKSDRDAEISIGDATFYAPTNIDFRSRLPQYLASLVYGCYFETYYLQKTIDKRPVADCLPAFVECYSAGKGNADASLRCTFLDSIGVVMEKYLFSDIEDAYFEKLVRGNHLDMWMILDPEKYVRNGTLLIDVPRLRAEMTKNILEHATLFLKFVDRLKNCLDSALS
jgi:hypothetical protein